MSPPRLLVRADTRPGVGAGHALREVALGEEWRRVGGEVVVALDAPADLPDHVTARLAAVGAVVDAGRRTTGVLVADLRPDVTVLDGYGFDAAAQHEARDQGRPVVVVDDHGRLGRYCADVVVDQNLGPVVEGHRARPPGSALLHGPRFALLRREFTDARPAPPDERGPMRVVVLVGGAAGDATEALAVAIESRLGPRATVTTPGRAGATAHLAPLLAGADVVVSAAGSTAWELAHLGRPMVLFAVADNQVPVGTALGDAGAARWLGMLDPSGPAAAAVAADAVESLLADPEEGAALGAVAARLVDGRGARRVVTELRSSGVALRDAGPHDAQLLWAWANDPEVRAASFGTDPIPLDHHLRWFERRLADPTCRILVAEDGGGPWGQVRFEQVGPDGEATVGVSVADTVRGQGRAAPLLRAATRRLFATTPAESVLAWVKPSNGASLAAFESADFARVPPDDETTHLGAPEPGAVPFRYRRGRDGRP